MLCKEISTSIHTKISPDGKTKDVSQTEYYHLWQKGREKDQYPSDGSSRVELMPDGTPLTDWSDKEYKDWYAKHSGAEHHCGDC